MRVCVIGNSHIAALKLGWDALLAADPAAWAEVKPTFFGAPSDGMRHIKLEDGCIVPKRKDIAEHFQRMSGGQDKITLADYDGFFLVGLNVSVKRILRFYKTHAWVGLAPDAEKTLVHPKFMEEFLTERYSSTRLVDMAAMLKSVTGRPVVAMAEPHWAAWIRHGQEGTADYGWDKAITSGDAPQIGAAFQQTVTAALAPYATLLPQPPETVQDGIMTAAAYNKDASRLISGEGGGTDAAHMNAAFGQTIWPLVRQSLQAQLS
ncbi:hypothetical protein GCM10010873_10520 [Cypionkella aquatica]|uniref:Uncharacterized protein n=1 Tax=Cypionkella aquatica TaxID=1756042 RepID=A0AA37TV05_9RHOB|nr:hypothetical protein [Cypionkella aquatica]GLS86078.1 hypothetical protein GCM10010873_10520 [Cypionkella aquatica]